MFCFRFVVASIFKLSRDYGAIKSLESVCLFCLCLVDRDLCLVSKCIHVQSNLRVGGVNAIGLVSIQMCRINQVFYGVGFSIIVTFYAIWTSQLKVMLET